MEETRKIRLGNDNCWSLHGMTTLVTGGTKGIGHEVVEELARLGAGVYTEYARNEADYNAYLQIWEAKGFQVSGSVIRTSICDVASHEQRESLMQIISSKFDDKLNILDMEEARKVSSGNDDRWSLHGMTAVVTGGTKGIGHEVVEELARQGVRVYTCARNGADLDSCLRNWEAKGLQVCGSICDVASHEQRENLMQLISSKFDGKLNILVNNTGTNIRRKTEEFTPNEYAAVMATNLESAFHLCQLAHPLLKASGFGSIIMMSSVSGVVSVNVGSVYGVTKGTSSSI